MLRPERDVDNVHREIRCRTHLLWISVLKNDLSSFIQEATSPKITSRFFKLESPHCGLVNRNFFFVYGDGAFFLDFIPVLVPRVTLIENKISKF